MGDEELSEGRKQALVWYGIGDYGEEDMAWHG